MATQTIAAATQGAAPAQGQPTHAGMAILKQYWPQLRHLLPSHVKPEAWYSAVYAALYRGQDSSKDLDLWRCADRNPESLMFALFDAARQGLEPGTEQYYLTPRPNRKAKNNVEVLGIRGYQGEIELIYRAGAVSSVIVETVRRNDEYRYQRGVDQVPLHRFKAFASYTDRGPLLGVYAYGVMRDGSISRVVELNQDDIDRAKKASASARSEYSPWVTDEAAMWLKTGVHRLTKFVPTSAEFRNTVETITASAAAIGAAAGDDRRTISDAARTAIPGVPVPAPSAPAVDAGAPPPIDITQFAQPASPEDEAAAAELGPSESEPASADAPEVELVTEFPPVPPVDGESTASRAVQTTIARVLAKAGISTDEQRYTIAARLAGRTDTIDSTAKLTSGEGRQVVTLLTGWQDRGVLDAQVAAVLVAAAGGLAPTVGDADLPAVGTAAWHDAGHPTNAADGSGLLTVPALRNGDCGICEQDAADGGES